jgi:hypothetical protein
MAAMTALAATELQDSPVRLLLRGAAVLLTAGALVWLAADREQLRHTPAAVHPLTLAGEHYRVDDRLLASLLRYSEIQFTDGEVAAREVVAAELAQRLDDIFARVHRRVPEFADWYYSLAGEYSRIAMGALAWANLTEPGYVAAHAATMLFPDEAWAADLGWLEYETAARLRAHQQQIREGWLAGLTERLAAHRVPSPLPTAAASEQTDSAPVRIDQLLAQLTEREREALETRVAISTLAGGGAAAGTALWRAAGARNPAAAGRAAARTAGRGASRAGTAAASSTALCAPAGAAAIGCGVIAGAATWLAVDWLLLRVDEQLNREELVASLESGLAALRAEIEQELIAGYDRALAGHYSAVREEIRGSFVPARAGRSQDSGSASVGDPHREPR